MSITVGLVVASVRPHEAAVQFAEMLEQRTRPTFISIAFQGTDDDYAELSKSVHTAAEAAQFSGYSLVHDRGHGASRARNVALAQVPRSVDWVWTPNDTTRPHEHCLDELTELLADTESGVGVLALNYRVSGGFRRRFAGSKVLSGWKLWHVIEPATVWRRDPLIEAGGFDPRIGPGSSGWAQAGEGTDAIYRIRSRGWSVSSVPISVIGRPQHNDSRRIFQWRKEFYYAVGLGCVIRRHSLGLRGILAVGTPLINWALRRKQPGDERTFALACIASTGRLIGIALGDRVCYLERSSEHWR